MSRLLCKALLPSDLLHAVLELWRTMHIATDTMLIKASKKHDIGFQPDNREKYGVGAANIL